MSGHRLRLLLIEDSVDDTELISRALLHGGFELELAVVDSEVALREALAKGEYDLAMTDHDLPGFDSAAVLETFAELAPDLPCVLVSGKVGEEAVGTAMRQGAVDYVAKDSLGSLPAAVERTLAESERRRQGRTTDEALARSGRLFEAVFVNAGDAMLIVEDEGRLVDANPAAAALFARPREQLVNLRVDTLMPGLPDAGEGFGEVELVRPDGELIATEYTTAANFVPGRHVMVMRDVRARHEAEAGAKRHTARQEALAEFGKRALCEESLELLKEEAVRRVAATLGVEVAILLELRAGERSFVVQAATGPRQERAGTRVPHSSETSSQASYTVSHAEPVLVERYEGESRFERDPVLSPAAIHSALSVEIPGDPQPYGVLYAASARSGAFQPDDGRFMAAVANVLADALRRGRSEEGMRELALHDSLTGLPNPTLFFDRLTVALARTRRLGTRLAVLFLDIDHFKVFNDTLGHRATDRLLTQVGARIERTMRETDTVARFGGDEFVVLCEDLGGEDEAEILATRLIAAFEAPFSFDEERHRLSASIGVALSDSDNLDGEWLLRDAEIAMYRSKESGRGTWTLATAEMRLTVIERVETKRALEKAIESDELLLHYQPIVELDAGGLVAVEALVRWSHGERGLIPPGEFIPLAEESGLIVRLGEWVLRAACRQAALWRAEFADDAPLPIHVNLSARQVAQLDLPQLVRQVLEETDVPPGDISLEITESALIEGLRGPMTALTELKAMGISIVLDDFGTGYSSLSYLDRFPIDTLKIDRAFVSQMESATTPAPIVAAIVGMARALAVETVAEGVETAEQTAAVTALGCKFAQGYFFARPAPADEVERLIRDDSGLRRRAAEARALAPPAAELTRAGARVAVERPRAESVPEYRAQFLEALLAADSGAANQIVHSALADRITPDAVDAQVIGAAMVEIGDLWESGEVSVAQEHLATGIALRAAGIAASAEGFFGSRISASAPPPTVLLANVEGDEHVLGLRMVSDMLTALGFDVRYLGSKVPAAELCDIAARLQPRAIGLSLTLSHFAPRLAQQAAALRRVCPEALLLFGGQGVPPLLVERAGATFVRDVEALVDAAGNGLLRAPALAI